MPEFTEVNNLVLEIANRCISDYHADLREANVGFIFRTEAPETNGKITLGKASKVSAQQRAAGLDLHFLIWIAQDVWDRLTEHARMALIDHELCHCYMVGDEAKLRGHDIEEFNEIIDRYGFWNQSLMNAAPTIEKAFQLDFGMEFNPSGSVVAVNPAQVPQE